MSSLDRARVLADLGRHAEARAEVAAHLAGEPASVAGLCLLAHCDLALDDPRAALAATESALAVAPEEEWALRLRALALADVGRTRAAREAAQAAVRADPQGWRAHVALAEVQARAGDNAEAYVAALRAVELAPHEADAHVMRGTTLAALGEKKAAQAAYREALRLDPESANALNNLAVLDLGSARLGRAARHVTAGLRLAPSAEHLQRNLDLVVSRLLVRLLNVLVLTGLLPMVLITATEDHTWGARAAVGAVQVCVFPVVTWLTLRHLPRGARRHLLWRMDTVERWLGVVLVALTAVLLLMALVPGSLWDDTVMIMAVRLSRMVVGFWVFGWLLHLSKRQRYG